MMQKYDNLTAYCVDDGFYAMVTLNTTKTEQQTQNMRQFDRKAR